MVKHWTGGGQLPMSLLKHDIKHVVLCCYVPLFQSFTCNVLTCWNKIR